MAYQLIGADPETGELPPVVEAALSAKNAQAQLASTISRANRLRRTRTALADVRRKPFKWVSLGNSVDEGQGATTEANRYVAKVRSALQQGWPSSAGREVVGYVPVNYFQTSFPERWVIAGTYTENNNWGLGMRAIRMEEGSTATISVEGVTSVDLMFGRGTFTGLMDVLVDGVSQGTTQTAAGSNTDGHRRTILLPNRSAHTIVVKPAEAFPLIFEGAVLYDGNESSGVQHFDAGHWGYTSAHFAGGGNGGTSLQQLMATVSPDLVTVGIVENDFKAGVAIATFKANCETIVTKIRAGGADPDIVWIVRPERSDDLAGGPIYAEYVAALQEIAATDSRMDVLDLGLLMPKVADDTGGNWADAAHPSNAGHALIGQYVAGFLTAGAPPPVGAEQQSEELIVPCLLPPFVATSGTPAVVNGSGVYAALAYDANAQEAAIARTRVPAHWTKVHVDLGWINVAASGSGDVSWRVNLRQQGAGELAGSTLFDTTIVSTVPGTQWTAASTRFASDLPITASKDVILMVIRMAAATQDTFTADVGAMYVRLVRAA